MKPGVLSVSMGGEKGEWRVDLQRVSWRCQSTVPEALCPGFSLRWGGSGFSYSLHLLTPSAQAGVKMDSPL